MIRNKTTIIMVVAAIAAMTISFRPLPIFNSSGLSRPIIIYKTRGDYSKNVPVVLSADKSKLISYPAPQDVYFKGALAYPTALADGYWLDNRGVNVNSAFLKLTYEEYSKLPAAPNVEELYKMIIDKSPFTHMYKLSNGKPASSEVEELNELIKHHKFKHFEKLI